MAECPTCGKSLQSERGMRQHHTKVHGEALPNRTCKSCETDFYDPQSRRTYCEDCHSETGEQNGNWRGGKTREECRTCGSEIEFYESNKNGVYCSECVENAVGLLPVTPSQGEPRVILPCTNCGTMLSRLLSSIGDNSYGVFCDTECYGSWLSSNIKGESHHQWKGGEIPYGTGWWQTRQRALKRDDYTCQRCGDTKAELGCNPDVHHLIPVREFGSPESAHSLANVLTLCRSCHRLVESESVAVPTP